MSDEKLRTTEHDKLIRWKYKYIAVNVSRLLVTLAKPLVAFLDLLPMISLLRHLTRNFEPLPFSLPLRSMHSWLLE
jgi:hypothetical protein